MTMPTGTTRERILRALVEVVLEGGLSDFSVQGVADRCGVSHRTVYRHFPTRESMLDGLVEQMSAVMEAAGGVAQVVDIDDLAGAVGVNFGLFTDHAALAEAAVRFSVGTATENRDRRRRTDAVSVAVGQLGLDGADARLVTGVLRLLSSSRSWLLLREAGLDPDDTAVAAGWAIEVLVDAVRSGRAPSGTARRAATETTDRPKRATR